jgi:hypothetical protein
MFIMSKWKYQRNFRLNPSSGQPQHTPIVCRPVPVVTAAAFLFLHLPQRSSRQILQDWLRSEARSAFLPCNEGQVSGYDRRATIIEHQKIIKNTPVENNGKYLIL